MLNLTSTFYKRASKNKDNLLCLSEKDDVYFSCEFVASLIQINENSPLFVLSKRIWSANLKQFEMLFLSSQ